MKCGHAKEAQHVLDQDNLPIDRCQGDPLATRVELAQNVSHGLRDGLLLVLGRRHHPAFHLIQGLASRSVHDSGHGTAMATPLATVVRVEPLSLRPCAERRWRAWTQLTATAWVLVHGVAELLSCIAESLKAAPRSTMSARHPRCIRLPTQHGARASGALQHVCTRGCWACNVDILDIVKIDVHDADHRVTKAAAWTNAVQLLSGCD